MAKCSEALATRYLKDNVNVNDNDNVNVNVNDNTAESYAESSVDNPAEKRIGFADTLKRIFYDFMEFQNCRKTFNKTIDKMAFLWYNVPKGFGDG